MNQDQFDFGSIESQEVISSDTNDYLKNVIKESKIRKRARSIVKFTTVFIFFIISVLVFIFVALPVLNTGISAEAGESISDDYSQSNLWFNELKGEIESLKESYESTINYSCPSKTNSLQDYSKFDFSKFEEEASFNIDVIAIDSHFSLTNSKTNYIKNTYFKERVALIQELKSVVYQVESLVQMLEFQNKYIQECQDMYELNVEPSRICSTNYQKIVFSLKGSKEYFWYNKYVEYEGNLKEICSNFKQSKNEINLIFEFTKLTDQIVQNRVDTQKLFDSIIKLQEENNRIYNRHFDEIVSVTRQDAIENIQQVRLELP